jgi:hypothetical protein
LEAKDYGTGQHYTADEVTAILRQHEQQAANVILRAGEHIRINPSGLTNVTVPLTLGTVNAVEDLAKKTTLSKSASINYGIMLFDEIMKVVANTPKDGQLGVFDPDCWYHTITPKPPLRSFLR